MSPPTSATVRVSIVVVALLLAARPPIAGQEGVHSALAGERIAVLALFARLPPEHRALLEQRLSGSGIDLGRQFDLMRGGQSLGQSVDQSVIRTIQNELKPIPISANGFVDVFPNRILAPVPTGPEAARLLKAAESVGRIEVAGRAGDHEGTAFVVAPGIVATNCHVLRQIARQDAGGAWTLAPAASSDGYIVDFGYGPDHESAREFRIESIAAYSAVSYLDVALLRVSATNASGAPLPDALPMRREAIAERLSATPLGVAVIGYPSLTNLVGDRMTQTMFRTVRERAGAHSRLLSPGQVIGIDRHSTIDFLDHIASTHAGQSGAPVIDVATGQVVGVHSCCKLPGLPQTTDPLACSSQRLSDRANNKAISSWTAVADAALRNSFGR
jgi:V8-like Glu-specific endopeptidase